MCFPPFSIQSWDILIISRTAVFTNWGFLELFWFRFKLVPWSTYFFTFRQMFFLSGGFLSGKRRWNNLSTSAKLTIFKVIFHDKYSLLHCVLSHVPNEWKTPKKFYSTTCTLTNFQWVFNELKMTLLTKGYLFRRRCANVIKTFAHEKQALNILQFSLGLLLIVPRENDFY